MKKSILLGMAAAIGRLDGLLVWGIFVSYAIGVLPALITITIRNGKKSGTPN